MGRRSLFMFIVMALASLVSAPAFAQFSGDLAFMPDACKTKRECILKNALKFVDDAKQVWEAEAGDLTDGASIPDWAQGLIGGPWDESYLKAAIVHDHYCVHRIRSWRATHLMLYDALIALGVSEFKAKVMYYSVYLGGPKWIEVLEPMTCADPTGAACGEAERLKVVGMIEQPERYGAMNMHKEMAKAEAMMLKDPNATLDDIENMARASHPDDKFYTLGDAVLDSVAAKRHLK